MTIKIGYDNVFERTGALITVSGGTKADAYNYLLAEKWAPASASPWIKFDLGHCDVADVDFIGIAGHNLGTESSVITVAHSRDDVTYTTTATISPTDDTTIMQVITAGDNRYWKISFTNGTDVQIGHISLGQLLNVGQPVTDAGFVAPKYAHSDRLLNGGLQGGVFARRKRLVERYSTMINCRFLQESWFTDNWAALYAHLSKKPFFILWDADNHASDAAFAWCNQPPRPSHSDAKWMNFMLDVECRA